MPPGSTWPTPLLVAVLLLILISAFISLAETAYLNMSKAKLRNLIDNEVPKAGRLNNLLEQPESVYRTMTVGNTLVNVSASALGATWVATMNPTGNLIYDLLIAIFGMMFLILIFGEILPEALGRRYSERVALSTVGLSRVLLVVLYPFVALFYGVSSLILRIFGIHKGDEVTGMTREEFRNIVDGTVEEGLLDLEEKEIIENVTEFGELRVADVMTQRYDMVALEVDASYEEIIQTIREEKFSRIPIYRATTDDIVGVLNVKDLMFTDPKPEFNLIDYVRPAYFTYEFKLVQELFREMRFERTHLAVVLDEYGGTVGIVTIEDFLEAIVGDIEDEYDDEPDTVIWKIDDSTYEMDGATKLSDLQDDLGFQIDSEDVDTIAGFIIEVLGNFPEEGQVIPWNKYEFTVMEIEKNRLNKIRVTELNREAPAGPEPTAV